MLILAFFITALVAFLFGYYWRELWVWKSNLDTMIVDSLAPRQPAEPEVTGKVVEPINDPIAAAKAEFEAEQRRLNP